MKYIVVLLWFCLIDLSCKNQLKTISDCASQDIVPTLIVKVYGYDLSSVRNILVKVYDHSILIDSFYIKDNSYLGDSVLKRFSVGTTRPLNIKYIYKIYISDSSPFILSNMKIIPVEHYSSFGRATECLMNQYDLDGITYSNGNPLLIKRQ